MLKLQAANDMLAEKVQVLTDTLYCHAGAAACDLGSAAESPAKRSRTDGDARAAGQEARSVSPQSGGGGGDAGRGAAGDPGALRALRRERDALMAECEHQKKEAADAKAGESSVRGCTACVYIVSGAHVNVAR